MEKISASQRKTVKSLSSAKGRKEHGAFIVERTKTVLELLDGPYPLRMLIATSKWYDEHRDIYLHPDICFQATTADMERMTTMRTPSDVIAVFDLPCQSQKLALPTINSLTLALDGIQDPGNMGTIVRLADWFGVRDIYAGHDTVDVFNPKCILATMGSIARVTVHYCDLEEFLFSATQCNIPVWGTFLDGENIYRSLDRQAPTGIIVMGNEGKGISPRIAELVRNRIHIPAFPNGRPGAESLNVAMATAITLAEFRRHTDIDTN